MLRTILVTVVVFLVGSTLVWAQENGQEIIAQNTSTQPTVEEKVEIVFWHSDFKLFILKLSLNTD